MTHPEQRRYRKSLRLPAVLLLFSNRFDKLATAAVLATLAPYVAICASAFAIAETPLMRAVAALGAITTAGILAIYFLP